MFMLYLMTNLSGITYEVNEEQKRRAILNGVPEENFVLIEGEEETSEETKVKSLKSEILENTEDGTKFKKVKVKKIKV